LSALSQVTVGIAKFPGPWLGMAFPGAVWIDQTAAGYGWYLDPSPAADGVFPALPGSPAYGKVDLLTVVEHELGHELGLADTTGDGLMGVFLPTGVRRVPGAEPVLETSPGPVSVFLPAPPFLVRFPLLDAGLELDGLVRPSPAPPPAGWALPAGAAPGPSGATVPPASIAPVLLAEEQSSGEVPVAKPARAGVRDGLAALDAAFAAGPDS
jgi:hypothetical protein